VGGWNAHVCRITELQTRHRSHCMLHITDMFHFQTEPNIWLLSAAYSRGCFCSFLQSRRLLFTLSILRRLAAPCSLSRYCGVLPPLFTLSILRRLAAPCSLSRYCGIFSPLVHSLDTAASCRPLFTLSILRRLFAPCSLSRYCGALPPLVHSLDTAASCRPLFTLSILRRLVAPLYSHRCT